MSRDRTPTTPASLEPPAPVVDEATALLVAVSEDPSDDAHREAYRAHLAAVGDPWAEVIALQERRFRQGDATPANAAREAELLARHATRWLGPIAPVVVDPRFERGFLVACCLWPKGAKTAPAIGDPRWSTVETLHFTAQRNWGRDVFMHPVLRGVRHLVEAPDALVEALLRDPTPRPIESIEMASAILPRALPATLVAPGLMGLRAFSITCWMNDPDAALRGLTWHPPERFAGFLASPFASRLSRLRWAVHDAQLVALHDALTQHAPPAFNACVDALHLSFRRGDDGQWSDIEVKVHGVAHALKNLNSGVKAVTRLSPERVRRLTVSVAPGEDATRLAGVCDAIRARFPDARLTLPA